MPERSLPGYTLAAGVTIQFEATEDLQSSCSAASRELEAVERCPAGSTPNAPCVFCRCDCETLGIQVTILTAERNLLD